MMNLKTVGVGGVLEIDWQSCILKNPRTSDKLLFELARRVVSFENERGLKLSTVENMEIFSLWKEASKQYIRPIHDYFTEFLSKKDSVNIPFGETLKAALQRAKLAHCHPALINYPNPQVILFVSLCRELHFMMKEQEIMLGQEAVASVLECDQKTISNYIKAVKNLGILKTAHASISKKKAATYFYCE